MTTRCGVSISSQPFDGAHMAKGSLVIVLHMLANIEPHKT